MRRRLLLAVVIALGAAPVSAQAPQPESGKGDPDVVTLRGCVSGSLLKSVQADITAGAATLATSDRYRMVGSKDVRARIKKANKTRALVTGRIKPGPQSVSKETTMGKTRVGIGVTPGVNAVDQQAPYTPTIEVEAIEVLAKGCDAG
jgi:hypothetical protein